MKAENNIFNKVLPLWQKIYRLREGLVVGSQWQVEAMRRIRLMGPLGSRPPFLELYEQMVWRLAPATSFLLVILVVFLLVSGLTRETDLLSSFLSDPEELDLAQLLGFGG
jgi:hypothetical protein